MVIFTVIQVDIGERAFGVAASRGDLILTIRALYEVEMDKLMETAVELFKGIAKL